ncbi:MAG TPA: Gfo/Idh/MocA family oxidoreductase [Flavisolibacter sp.]|nr:Gfo/Idh/MocA family oxidoreductase [Flavisolibacter sp.]
MKKFGLIGVAGFVAPKHLEAISRTGSHLLAAMDRSDSVGILDRFFPQAGFFTDIDRFDSYLEQLRREKSGIDYLSVCTPNHLHDEHVRLGLKHNADVICEKPLVLDPGGIEPLVELEKETGRRIFNLLQLRLHPDIIRLQEKQKGLDRNSKAEVELVYITPRGRWYHNSWKGDEQRSGGIATNIGIHFFDMLLWIFGPVQHIAVHHYDKERAAGYLELQKARVRWFLSINEADLPADRVGKSHSFRQISVEGETVEFSTGFTDLHIKAYEAILAGKGFGLEEAFPSIELVHNIRTQKPSGLKNDFHPMAAFLKQ